MRLDRWGKIGSKFSHLTSVHPCYNEQAHFKVARMHLPVAPRCNIQCNYCTRAINKCEHRPGVTGYIVTASEALNRLEKAVKEMPNLRVVGIAGPGEPLANSQTFETLKLVNERFPKLIKCTATNGLLLPQKAEQLRSLNLRTVTVTVNAVEPKVGSKIYSWVRYDGKVYRGEEAAKILIDNQFRGIEAAYKHGLIVKINTVLISQINSEQIREIAKMAVDRGAVLMNIMPLIPLYKFKDLTSPSCEDLKAARRSVEDIIPQWSLCRQCRADAVGIPASEPFTSLNQGLVARAVIQKYTNTKQNINRVTS